MSIVDFIQLVANDLHQQPVKRGANVFFKCPFHGSGNEKTGSMKVSNGDSSHGPGWHCFGCAEHGSPVSYFLKRGDTLEDARRKAGSPAQAGNYSQAETYAPPDNPPGQAWQKRAREFMAYSRKQFDTFAQASGSETDWSITDTQTGEKIIKHMAPVEWWIERGLSVPTAQYWGIGYNPRTIKDPREKWGLTPDSEKPFVWIPQGIVIPCVVGSDVWYIKIRQPKGDPKFIHVTGSKPALYMAENLQANDSAVFTEGELDALLLWQEVADFTGVATLGAATERLNVATWGLHLLSPRHRFTAYDLDEAGKKGAEELARFNFKRLEVQRVSPFDKDLTDYYKHTGRLREWLISEFEKVPGTLPEALK
jgi:hypothetical protein